MYTTLMPISGNKERASERGGRKEIVLRMPMPLYQKILDAADEGYRPVTQEILRTLEERYLPDMPKPVRYPAQND